LIDFIFVVDFENVEISATKIVLFSLKHKHFT
jgi:hypothetical protein